MILEKLVEESLKLKVMDEYGTLLPRSVIVENYLREPGIIGDGNEQVENYLWKIQLIYVDKSKLIKDVGILKKKFDYTDGYSNPTVEFGSDPEHKRWTAIIYIEGIGGEDNV